MLVVVLLQVLVLLLITTASKAYVSIHLPTTRNCNHSNNNNNYGLQCPPSMFFVAQKHTERRNGKKKFDLNERSGSRSSPTPFSNDKRRKRSSSNRIDHRFENNKKKNTGEGAERDESDLESDRFSYNTNNKYDYDDDEDYDLNYPMGVTTNSQPPHHHQHQKKSSIASVTTTTSSKSHFFSQKDLHDMSFQKAVQNVPEQVQLFQQLCRIANIQKPSKIQSLTWPILLSSQQQQLPVIIADQTGSGKTLAYLVPLIHRIIATKLNEKNTGTYKKLYGTPRVLILAPTAELADQIHTVCQQFTPSSIKTVVVTSSGKFMTSIRDQIRMIQRESSIDILISTPGRLSTILRSKNSGGLDLSILQAIVLDEVDVLLVDETFGPQLRTVGAAMNSPSVTSTTTDSNAQSSSNGNVARFVFVTATLPDTVVEQVEREFASAATTKTSTGTSSNSNIIKITGPGLHRVAPTIQCKLIDVSVSDQSNEKLCFDIKADNLLSSLRQYKCPRTLIFCNTVENCRKVENLLSRIDRKKQLYDVRAYHNAMTPEARNTNLDAFSGVGSNNNAADDVESILVCTDRAARGVDFGASPVDHVVLFDFPKDPAEYIRRVGRTARAGRNGIVTVMAYGWQLPIARSIIKNSSSSSDSRKNPKLVLSVEEDNRMDEDEDEFTGGARRRKQQPQNKQKKRNNKLDDDDDDNDSDVLIGKNIAKGKLWKQK